MRTETMAKAYIEAIYFTDTGDNDQPEPTAELTPLTKAKAYIDCRNFIWALDRVLVTNDLDPVQLGHDLWLTRNGHGASFLDREEIYGEELTPWLVAMATCMGEHDAEFEEPTP